MQTQNRKAMPVRKRRLQAKDIAGIEKEISEESLRERRYLWTARAFAIVFAMSLCVNIILLLGLMHILPTTRVQPFYLTFQDKDEQIVRVQKMDVSDNVLRAITESYIRQYLFARLKITSDTNEMAERWSPHGPVKWMSSDVIYSDFMKTTTPVLDKIHKDGFIRDVKILSIIKSASNRRKGDVWQIELETHDMTARYDKPEITKWVILMRVQYRPNQDVKYAYRLKNPLGFTVLEYVINRKNTAETTK